VLENNHNELHTDHEAESLLHAIHDLSSKTHAAAPPAFTQFQKETAIVQAALEKILIELMADGMAIKVVLMSVFYFWFMLDAPLRVDDPEIFDDYSPFEEMGNIIALVKLTTDSLPAPKFSYEIKLLNEKMQSLRPYLPDPQSLDFVSPDTVRHHSTKVNTAIHTLTSDYLMQGYHPESISNSLFSQWLRLSVFYGVSESDWQKMDFYFVEILNAVRKYIPTIAIA
jgi:hypothetical protein